MAGRYVRAERQDAVLLLTLDRPPVNALSVEVLEALTAIFEGEAAEAAVRAVVVAGAGRTWAAGADLAMFRGYDPLEGAHPSLRLANDLFNLIEAFPKPVVAAVHGACLGGGNELALACDLRVASTRASFGQPEVRLGLAPGWGGMQRLPRLIGRGHALDLLLTGRTVDAVEALTLGLVTAVVEPDELSARALDMASRLAALPPLALAAVKERVARGMDEPQGRAIRDDEWAFGELLASEDGQEGITAFLEKRPARWTGS